VYVPHPSPGKAMTAHDVHAHPAWWGFVFPVAAMALSIAAVGSATTIMVIQLLGSAATIVLAVLWVGVAVTTVRMAPTAKAASSR